VITTNLSTRPFYNERVVRFWLMVVAIVAVLATLINVTRLLYYSRSDTRLTNETATDETRSAELRASAARLRASVNPKQIQVAAAQAREANELIDRRTFSWTELFNQLEMTLPADARITAVRPHLERDRGMVLSITVLARSVDDVDQFMEHLVATGSFTGLLSREEHVNEAGQVQAALEGVYRPRPSEEPAAPTPGQSPPAQPARTRPAQSPNTPAGGQR
jgi:Tfp pilus assembly protein PilN